MNMKRIIRFAILLIMFVMISIQCNTTTTYARNDEGGGGSGKSTKWTSQSPIWWKPTEEDVGQPEIKDRANVIVKVLRNIGIVLAVVALMIIGIRNMTASAEEKSILKESMPGYLIGVFMVVAVTFLPSLIYEIVKNL